jgi:NAD(P)-dependent dehydrogenase (short-subunit alcohol dehydrogenase family)
MSGSRRSLRARLVARAAHPRARSDAEALRTAVDDRVVVVTGASHGIGRATATLLAEAGAHVLLVARSADVLDELALELGPRARAFPCDLSDEDAVAELAGMLLAHRGHVDVVVSNAGRSIRRSLADSYDRLHDVTRTTAINYHGPVALMLGLLPAMRARGSGHVVNVSTIGVRIPPAPRWAAYVASKRAFDAWLRSAAAEIHDDGVTTTTVYFGLVHTRMSAPSTDFDTVPGLSPQGAAAIVADAIVRRPTAIAPWWAALAGAAGELAPGATARMMRRYGARLDDGPRR